MIVDKILSFLDKYIHKKRIIKFLEDKFIVTVIDIGSHKGEFINSVLNISSVSNVISFEPQKNIFDLLQKSFSNNTKINLNNSAVAEKSGKKIMQINKLSDTSTLNEVDNSSLFFKFKSFLLHEKNSVISEEVVSTTTIDSFFKNKKLCKNVLLKIDTEGYEFNVLLGAKKTIQRIKYVLIENQFSKMYKNVNFEDCHEFLTQHQFKLTKKFKFPTFHYEDRFYINTNVVIKE
jgi:FkbM family methyltransferase